MVDRSPELNQLNQIIDAMRYFAETAAKEESPKHEEFANLLRILKNYNNQSTHTDTHFWEDKKYSTDPTIEESIRQAEEAMEIFQNMFPFAKTKVNRSVNEKIIALYAALDKEKELSKFEANVKNLKERWKRLKAVVQTTEEGRMGG